MYYMCPKIISVHICFTELCHNKFSLKSSESHRSWWHIPYLSKFFFSAGAEFIRKFGSFKITNITEDNLSVFVHRLFMKISLQYWWARQVIQIKGWSIETYSISRGFKTLFQQPITTNYSWMSGISIHHNLMSSITTHHDWMIESIVLYCSKTLFTKLATWESLHCYSLQYESCWLLQSKCVFCLQLVAGSFLWLRLANSGLDII